MGEKLCREITDSYHRETMGSLGFNRYAADELPFFFGAGSCRQHSDLQGLPYAAPLKTSEKTCFPPKGTSIGHRPWVMPGGHYRTRTYTIHGYSREIPSKLS